MKKFDFPLTRVMDWRHAQARIEEIKLESLYAELRSFDAREAVILEQRTQSEDSLLAAPSVTGIELAALDAYKKSVELERGRIEKARAACRQRIAAQIQAVAVRRREVKLLEKLKEQRLKTWRAGLAREIDQQASEAYLAKWPKRRSQSRNTTQKQ